MADIKLSCPHFVSFGRAGKDEIRRHLACDLCYHSHVTFGCSLGLEVLVWVKKKDHLHDVCGVTFVMYVMYAESIA